MIYIIALNFLSINEITSLGQVLILEF